MGVLCTCVDDTQDKVKRLIDGGTVSRETTCGESLTDFLFLGLDNIIMGNLSEKRVIVFEYNIVNGCIAIQCNFLRLPAF